MKGFLLGLIVGAVAHAAASAWYMRLNDESPPSREHISAPMSAVRETPPAVPASSPVSATDGSSNAAVPRAGRADCISPDDEAALSAATKAIYDRDQARRQASRDAEPKDPGWSASMEQQLTTYIARHPHGNRFQLTSIDCRTTFCELNAEGGPSGSGSQEAFQEIMIAIAKDLNLMSGAAGGVDDGTVAKMMQRFRRYSRPCSNMVRTECVSDY